MAERAMVDLSLDAQAIVQDAVASGEFGTHEDVVAHALREWQANRSVEDAGPKLLRKKWAEAILANGPYYSLEEVMDPLEVQYACLVEPHPEA